MLKIGANIGVNLMALNTLYPCIDAYGIEINVEAVCQLEKGITLTKGLQTSILDFYTNRTRDLALIMGWLIHISPKILPRVYDRLIAGLGRYLTFAEVYGTAPVIIPYRSYIDRLFNRNFAGDIIERLS
jgi:spore coat polysaccharide biosynthesis protein SpsF